SHTARVAGSHRTNGFVFSNTVELNGTPAAFTDNRFHHSNVGMDRMAGQISTTIESFKTKREQGA
ncbi:hypothetical protein XocVXO32_22605, partial [Xanthomonas oryzae pv. oryzicola]